MRRSGAPTPGGAGPWTGVRPPSPLSGQPSNHALPPGYREGFLWKRGRDNGQFLSRKFVLTEREGALKYFNRSDVSGLRGLVPHPQLPRALPGDTLPPPDTPVGTLRPLLVTATPSGVGGAGGTPRPLRDGTGALQAGQGPGQRVEGLAGPARGHQGICSPRARRGERSGRQGGEQEGGTWPRVGWTRVPARTPPGKLWFP